MLNLRLVLRAFLRRCALHIPPIRRLVEQRNQLQKELDDARQQIRRLNQDFLLVQDLISQLETESGRLFANHDAVLKERQQLEHERNIAWGERDELRVQCDSLVGENERLSNALNAVTAERNKLTEL